LQPNAVHLDRPSILARKNVVLHFWKWKFDYFKVAWEELKKWETSKRKSPNILLYNHLLGLCYVQCSLEREEVAERGVSHNWLYVSATLQEDL